MREEIDGLRSRLKRELEFKEELLEEKDMVERQLQESELMNQKLQKDLNALREQNQANLSVIEDLKAQLNEQMKSLSCSHLPEQKELNAGNQISFSKNRASDGTDGMPSNIFAREDDDPTPIRENSIEFIL